jgi:hypothetical protein
MPLDEAPHLGDRRRQREDERCGSPFRKNGTETVAFKVMRVKTIVVSGPGASPTA